MRLADSEWDALIAAAHMARVLDGAFLAPGGQHPRAVFRKLKAKGLVTEEYARKVDGDGFGVEPERYGICYALTEPGRRLAAALETADKALFDGAFEATQTSRKEP